MEARGYHLQPHVQPGILPTVFPGDIEPVRMFVLDAAFLTHLHEMALWLTKEYGLNNTRLWEVLREETDLAFEAVRHPCVAGIVGGRTQGVRRRPMANPVVAAHALDAIQQLSFATHPDQPAR